MAKTTVTRAFSLDPEQSRAIDEIVRETGMGANASAVLRELLRIGLDIYRGSAGKDSEEMPGSPAKA